VSPRSPAVGGDDHDRAGAPSPLAEWSRNSFSPRPAGCRRSSPGCRGHRGHRRVRLPVPQLPGHPGRRVPALRPRRPRAPSARPRCANRRSIGVRLIEPLTSTIRTTAPGPRTVRAVSEAEISPRAAGSNDRAVRVEPSRWRAVNLTRPPLGGDVVEQGEQRCTRRVRPGLSVPRRAAAGPRSRWRSRRRRHRAGRHRPYPGSRRAGSRSPAAVRTPHRGVSPEKYAAKQRS